MDFNHFGRMGLLIARVCGTEIGCSIPFGHHFDALLLQLRVATAAPATTSPDGAARPRG